MRGIGCSFPRRVTVQKITTPCDGPSITKCRRNVAYATKEGNMTRDEPGQGDRRVQRTDRLIVEALIELTTQKGFAAVTVQDIVQRAGINRATFYRHYRDKFDLLDQYAQAVYALPDHAPDSGSPMDAETRTISGVVRIFEHVREHAKFFRVMLGQNGDPAFVA